MRCGAPGWSREAAITGWMKDASDSLTGSGCAGRKIPGRSGITLPSSITGTMETLRWHRPMWPKRTAQGSGWGNGWRNRGRSMGIRAESMP